MVNRMKPMKRKPRLFRPADAFVPAAMLVACLLGREPLVFYVFLHHLVVGALGLAASRGARIAFATQPSLRDVRGTVFAAVCLQVGGGLLALLLGWAMFRGIPASWPFMLCGVLINIEHVFYEYLGAVGDRRSAAMSHGIAAMLLLTGMLLASPPHHTAPDSWNEAWVAGMAGLGALTGAALSLALGGGLRGRWNAGVLRCAGRAWLQLLLYPAAMFAALCAMDERLPVEHPTAVLISGWVLYEACCTPFRRSPLEARPLNAALLAALAVAAVTGVCALLIPLPAPLAAWFPHVSVALAVAALCAFALWGNLRSGDN